MKKLFVTLALVPFTLGLTACAVSDADLLRCLSALAVAGKAVKADVEAVKAANSGSEKADEALAQLDKAAQSDVTGNTLVACSGVRAALKARVAEIKAKIDAEKAKP